MANILNFLRAIVPYAAIAFLIWWIFHYVARAARLRGPWKERLLARGHRLELLMILTFASYLLFINYVGMVVMVQAEYAPSESRRSLFSPLRFQPIRPRRGSVVIARSAAACGLLRQRPQPHASLRFIGDAQFGSPTIIRRVIGLPGETITIDGNGTRVNGVRIAEPYARAIRKRARPLKVTLGEDEFLLVRDVRGGKWDDFSVVHHKQLYAREFFVLSPSQWGFVELPPYAVRDEPTVRIRLQESTARKLLYL